MLHTARFYIDLAKDEAYLIERNLGITLDQLKYKVGKKFVGITAWVIQKYGISVYGKIKVQSFAKEKCRVLH